MSRAPIVAVAIVACLACRERTEVAPTASASAAPAPSASSEPAPWFVGTWSGTYDSQRHAIDLDRKQGAPAAWAEEADEKRGAGKGTLEIAIDESGQAHAKAKGPLGELSGSGAVENERVALRLTPANPDEGYAGTLLTSLKDDALVGEIRASSPDSLSVRRAAVKLVKK
jgi:hypothetical protein